MALGDLAAVKVHLHVLGTTSESALGMQCISPFSNWRDLLAAEFLSTVMPDWLDILSFNVGLRDLVVSDVVPGTGVDVVIDPLVEPTGTYVGSPAPANAAYVISWRSDGIGRNTRGRNYLFGLPADYVTNAIVWSSGARAVVQNLVEVILAQYGPTGFSDIARLQVISRGPHNAPLPVPQAFPVTHAKFEQPIRSMRKRLLS